MQPLSMQPLSMQPLSMQPLSRELRALTSACVLSFFLILPAMAQGPLGVREQRINTTSIGSQVLPAADQNAAGDFVVIWSRESEGLDADPSGLFGQLFTYDGERRGEEFQVADSHAYNYPASVALADSGKFVVVWSDRDTHSLRARRFTADAVLEADDVVHDGGINAGVKSTTAVDGSGSYVVAWEYGTEALGTDVLARRFDAGPEIWGDVFKVPEGDAPSYDPAVAVATDGRFVVVYRQDGEEPGTSALRARRFSAASEAMGEEILVAPEATSPNFATPPAVEFFEAGGFAVAWVDVLAEEPHLYLRTYGPGGVVRSEPVEIDGPPAAPDPPRITVLAGDEILLVWRRKVQGGFLGYDGFELWGQLFDRFANPLGAAFPVTALGPGPGPALAAHPDGLSALVAFPYGDDIYGRILPPEGRGGVLQLADSPAYPVWSGIAEEEREITVSVLRTGGTVGRATVELFTVERSLTPGASLATAGEDFESVATTLVFEDGEFHKAVTFGISEDSVHEGNEVFTVNLAAPSGAMLRPPSEVEVTIYDDDRQTGEGPYPLEDAIRVTEEPPAREGRQRIAASATGFFLVVWVEDDGVHGRLYGPDGGTRGDELHLTDGGQDRPAVAAAPDGSFLVTWEQDLRSIRGRYVRPAGAGAPRLGPEMVLGMCDQLCSGINFDVDVTVGPSGRFAVSWVGASGGVLDPPYAVQAQVFESDGTPRGTKFEALTTELTSAVTWDADGGFVLVWTGDGVLQGQRFDAAGEPLAEGRFPVSDLGYPEPRPDAVAQADGGHLVVWQDIPSLLPSPDALFVRPGYDVFARRFGGDGTPGGTFRLTDFLPMTQEWPRLAAAPSGETVAVWSSSGELKGYPNVLFGRRFSSDGRLAGGRFPILPSGPGRYQSWPDVAYSGTGQVVVSWEESSGIYVRRYAGGSCVPSSRQLCLGEGRFALEVDWEDFAGKTGRGTSAPLTDDTGNFWFFGPQNIELVVKVLDGRRINGRFWVFYGSLSNVEYHLRVRDTVTGAEKTYVNPLGHFASVGDTQAFPGTDP